MALPREDLQRWCQRHHGTVDAELFQEWNLAVKPHDKRLSFNEHGWPVFQDIMLHL